MDKYYRGWSISILPYYTSPAGQVTNDLMANINPTQAGAVALARVPLCSRFAYAYAPVPKVSQKDKRAQRVNPFLAEDINTLLNSSPPVSLTSSPITWKALRITGKARSISPINETHPTRWSLYPPEQIDNVCHPRECRRCSRKGDPFSKSASGSATTDD